MWHLPSPDELPAIVQWAIVLFAGGIGAWAWRAWRRLVRWCVDFRAEVAMIAAMAADVGVIAKRYKDEDARRQRAERGTQ